MSARRRLPPEADGRQRAASGASRLRGDGACRGKVGGWGRECKGWGWFGGGSRGGALAGGGGVWGGGVGVNSDLRSACHPREGGSGAVILALGKSDGVSVVVGHDLMRSLSLEALSEFRYIVE